MPQDARFAELVITAPVGGLNEAASIDTMDNAQATEALNCEFWKGTIAKRRGIVQIGDQVDSGNPWSNERICYWATQYVTRAGVSTLLRVNGAHLYKVNGTVWVGAISGTNPAGATDVFGGGKNLGSHVQFNDVIYYADGDVTKRYDGTTIRDWSFAGGTMAAATLSAAVAGGSLSAGAYTMVYTLYDSSRGEETNPATVSNSIVAALNQKIPYSIAKPSGYTTNFDKVRIYRTTADGAGAWFFEAEVAASDWPAAGSTALTGFLTISDAALGAEVAYDNDPAPKWRFLQLHDERVVGGHIATTAPSQVMWSKPGAPFSVPSSNGQYLKRDDGHPIRAVFQAMFGNLYVAKQGGPIFELTPHPTLGYSPLQLPALHGCESHHSVIFDGNEAVFVDRLGIVRFNGQQSELISPPVQSTFRRLSAQIDTNVTGEMSLLQRAFGIHDQQSDRTQCRWTFALTTTNGIYDDQLVLDLASAVGESGAWHREQYETRGFRVFFAAQDPLNTGQKTPAIYACDGNGNVYRLRTDAANAEVFADSGGKYAMQWYSKWFGDGINDSIPRYVDIEIERSTDTYKSGSIAVTLWQDGDDTAPVVTKHLNLYDSFDSGQRRRTYRIDVPVPASGQYWKRLRIGFSHTEASGDVSIVKFIVWAIPVGARLIGVAS